MDYIIYFAITIGILVFVHELGHFGAAKLSGMRAEVFAIGFGKRLFGYNKLTGFTFGPLPEDFDGGDHTDYRLSMLPLGGYVKITGMVDESFDTEFAGSEPKPYEFRAQPTYKKLFVITAGVMMNLTLAVLIFWGVNFFQGKLVRETTTVGIVQENSIAEQAGFKTSDKILSVNSVDVVNWDDVINNIFIENLGSDVPVHLTRNDKDTTITVSSEVITESAQNGIFLSSAFIKSLVTEVVPNGPAEDAGLKPGDIFLTLNGKEILVSQDAIDIISSSKENVINAAFLRGEDTVLVKVTPSLEGRIGIALANGAYVGPFKYDNYTIIESFTQSISNITTYTSLTFSMFGNVIFGDVKFNKVFGGPVKIAKYAAQSAETGIVSFLYFLAMLSLSLAIINIMPFPVLDGGHMIIIIIEGIIRKELPLKVKIGIQNAGLAILLMLMVFIIYNDIISL